MTNPIDHTRGVEPCPFSDDLLEKLITAVLAHTDIGLRNGDDAPTLRMHKAAVKADLIEALSESPEAVTDEMIEAGVSFIYGMDHNFGETAERRCDLDGLRADIRALLDAALSKVSPLI